MRKVEEYYHQLLENNQYWAPPQPREPTARMIVCIASGSCSPGLISWRVAPVQLPR
jgi:hypothetical protein